MQVVNIWTNIVSLVHHEYIYTQIFFNWPIFPELLQVRLVS